MNTFGNMVDESKYHTRIAPFGVRIPPELKDRVSLSAEKNNRSMNAEIIHRLEGSFAGDLLVDKDDDTGALIAVPLSPAGGMTNDAAKEVAEFLKLLMGLRGTPELTALIEVMRGIPNPDIKGQNDG